ncbi:MAG: hypothetical protein V2A73_00595 [Pseudomonadota bacterium]
MAYLAPSGRALRQGDLLGGVRVFLPTTFGIDDQPTGMVREFSYSVIVTQDCDLEQDFKARFSESVSPDKLLFGVLLCGVYEEDKVRTGTHRPEAQKFSSREFKSVEQNQDPRYEYLGFVPNVGKKLVADFKDFFMTSCDFLYSEVDGNTVIRLAEMETPYREHVQQRFAWYLMRVGLPVDFHRLPEGVALTAPERAPTVKTLASAAMAMGGSDDKPK